MQIHASTYQLPEPSRSIKTRDLWSEMACDLAGAFSAQYRYRREWRFRIALLDQANASPDREILRYRTIQGAIRRRPSCPTLLDLSVGNLFCRADSSDLDALHVVTDGRYANWARKVSAIPLSDHLRLLQIFVADLQDAGWSLREASLKAAQIDPPRVRNGNGTRALLAGKFLDLARSPLSHPEGVFDVVVCGSHGRNLAGEAQRLEDAFARLLPRAHLPKFRTASGLEAGVVNLFVLGDRDDLMSLREIREKLRDAEAAGTRFKLAKARSLAEPYPSLNIAFDMFQIAGGRSWGLAAPGEPICCIDAGHDHETGRSRWAKVEADEDQTLTTVRVIDTELAEHVPAQIMDAMWPTNPEAIACRDGRLSQERAPFLARAAAEGRSVIEVKKSPVAILWRDTGEGRQLPAFVGDAVIDEHGEVLLQTAPGNVQDHVRPVRLEIWGRSPIDLAEAFLRQHAMAGLTLFKLARLPGALYFADLVSKLSSDGWPKSIGRGFRIPSVIP